MALTAAGVFNDVSEIPVKLVCAENVTFAGNDNLSVLYKQILDAPPEHIFIVFISSEESVNSILKMEDVQEP